MDFKTIRNVVTSKVGRQLLVAQKHSPKLMFIAGVVGVGATVVLAVRATLTADEVLEKHLAEAENLSILADRKLAEYSQQDYQKDLLVLHARTFGKLTKIYGPSIVVGVASVAALTGAHVVLNRRYAGATAAYAAIERGFETYRKRVEKELGPEKERELRLGLVDKEIVIETEEGPVTKVVKSVDKDSSGLYTFLFDKNTSSSWESRGNYNQFFIQCQQTYANNLLQSRGHVFLNEVLEQLGMEHCQQGAVVGWIKDSEDGDNYIDFGIFDDEVSGKHFARGDEDSVWLNFNVDGIIYDKLPKRNVRSI